MKRFVNDKKENKEKKRRYLQFTIFGLIGILVVLQISLSNSLSTFGENVLKMENDVTNLEKENTILQNEISKKESLGFIEQQAKQKGFITLENQLSIALPVPVALKP